MSVEQKIIKRFKEGDAEAFDVIYHAYSEKMFHFALGLVKDLNTAKDLVQEVFVNLWEKRDQLDLKLNFENYIFTIAYNSIRKFFRKKSIESKAIDHLIKNSPEVIESVDSTYIYNDELTPLIRTLS